MSFPAVLRQPMVGAGAVLQSLVARSVDRFQESTVDRSGLETLTRLARVLVIEDDPDVSEMVSAIVGVDARLVVVGTSTSAEAGLALALRHHPDVVILDDALDGPGLGSTLAPILRTFVAGIKIVFFSATAGTVINTDDADIVVDKFQPSGLLPGIRSVLGLAS